MRVRSILIFFSILLVMSGVYSQTPGLRNLGPQIRASVIQGSIFLKDSTGIPMVYTVVRGNPARLLAYQTDDGQLKFDQPLSGTDGAWDLAVASDGWLYIPGAKGMLYRHRPGTQLLENLGVVLPGETTVWNLAAGKDGEMFGATYPGCKVFRYHPANGFTDVGQGALVPGENYVRSLVYHQRTGKLFAGVGSHAELIELDPASGIKKAILPPNFKDKEFVYSLEILEGLPGGDRLLALITNGSFTLVYNVQTGEFEYQINAMDMKAVSQADAQGRFYYTLNSKLYSRNILKKEDQPIKHHDDAGSANALKMINSELFILNSDAVLIMVDVKTGKTKRKKLEVPGQPISLQTIMKGPDGRIWSGGYLAGGHAAYDPSINQTVSYPGLHQTEGMAVKGKEIYFGIYPKGMYYRYDSTKPWDVKNANPEFIGQIKDQSRSFAVLNDSVSGNVFFGMVPEYGKLGGHLVSYNTTSRELKSFGAIIKDQSIVSLTSNRALVWGGTSVSGGLGVKPVTEQAKLFSWNVQTQELVDELIPVPGAKAITTLIKGPDNNIWGMAGGTLFVFDPVKKAVIRRQEIYPTPPLTSHIWRDAFLILHPSGMVYGTGNNQLFRIAPDSLIVETLIKPASLLAMDDQGRLYFHRSSELWQYSPTEDVFNTK